jgi:putative peptide zinc metalloprotease protein
MATAFLSSDWYRVADLRLRRHSHVQLARHVYRGEVWHVLQDPQSGKMHRLTESAHAFFARLDGRRSVQDLWLRLCELFPDRPPSQTEILQLLAQLHSSDLILGDRLPNLIEVDRRAREEQRKTLWGYIKNPLSLRVPLFDPEPFLRWSEPVARAVFSPLAGVLWLALMVSALAAAFVNWQALALPRFEQVATASNIAYLAVAYIVVKALHELGHGFAVKRWGGEVRECGVMMLVFFPVPYVDASQATFFPSKWQRMVVSAAGIAVELAVAAAAFFIFLAADPGPLRTLAYNLMLIGGISTLLFNGNPLLRFDGYFVFADLMESPNLGQRSNQYFFHLVRRTILRDRDAPPPLAAPREGLFLAAYALVAFLYRMSVMFFISIYLAVSMPIIGTALVVWSLFTVLILPLGKGLRYLATDPSIDLIRGRVILRTVLILLVVLGGLFLLPVPHVTVADAVLDPTEDSLLRVQGQGFVDRVLVTDGQQLRPGDPVMVLSDPMLSLERLLAEAERQDAEGRLEALPLSDRNGRQLWETQVGYAQAKLQDLQRREARLTVRAGAAGRVYIPESSSLPGRYIQQGTVIATVLAPGPSHWRLAIPATDALPIDAGNRRIELQPRLGHDITLPAQIVQRAPEVTTSLPSFGVTTKGGGSLLTDPNSESPVSLVPVVNYVLAVDRDAGVMLPGGARARVRFVHDPSPIGPRIWRAAEQTFLRYFGR